MISSVSDLYRSAGFYPITGMYLAGVGLGLLVARGDLTFGIAVLVFALVAMGALLVAAWREIRAVHKLVNGQRHELLARIDELNALLVSSGVGVPATGRVEKQARADERTDSA